MHGSAASVVITEFGEAGAEGAKPFLARLVEQMETGFKRGVCKDLKKSADEPVRFKRSGGFTTTLAYADEASWPGLYRSNVVYLQSPTKDRLPVYRNLSFRLEKGFKLGPNRMVLMADVFNVFNWATVNRAYDAYLGTYYVDTDAFVANPYYRLNSEILNPRVLRLGVRFEF